MKRKWLIAVVVSIFWILLIPLWIGWVSFFGILSTLILFYPLLAPTLCAIFLYSFFNRKNNTTKNTAWASGKIAIILTLLMIFWMRSFLEPGIFSVEQNEFVAMGIIYFLLTLFTAMLGNGLRTLIKNNNKPKVGVR